LSPGTWFVGRIQVESKTEKAKQAIQGNIPPKLLGILGMRNYPSYFTPHLPVSEKISAIAV
jgi:hypothetical protein